MNRRFFKRHITQQQIAELNQLVESADYATDIRLGEYTEHDCAIVFVDLCNFTNISWSLPTKTIMGILQDLFEFSTQRFIKHGGMVDKYPGDGVVAFFPRSYSDKDDQIVEHALDAVAEIMWWFYEHLPYRYSLPKPSHSLNLAVGVDAGTVAIAHVGSAYHSELILIGDQVNCASKCQQAATAKEIVIGQDAAGRVRNIYSGYFSTGPSLGVVTRNNAPYRSFRFDWQTFAKRSSWIERK